MNSDAVKACDVAQAIEALVRRIDSDLAESEIIKLDATTRRQVAIAKTEALVQLILRLFAQEREATPTADTIRVRKHDKLPGSVH